MKNTNQCPKCGSREILLTKGRRKDSNSILLGFTTLSRLPVDHRICCDCGYIEMWAASDDLLFLKMEKQKQDKKKPFWK